MASGGPLQNLNPPPVTPATNTIPAQVYAPGQGERGALTVDITKPRQLVRFFRELEPLFVCGSITNEQEKKDMVLKYIELELEEVWARYPEYKDATKNYVDFKKAILDHYPDATGDFLYSLVDLDALIRECYQIGIRTLDDLTDHHNRFEAVTSWLREKDHIGKKEEERPYVGAFQPHF